MGQMQEPAAFASLAKDGPIGRSVKRKEDGRFVTGKGQYTDDVTLPGQTFGVFVRSPHAHARIREALDGNICRCTGYQNIVKSIRFCQAGSTARQPVAA